MGAHTNGKGRVNGAIRRFPVKLTELVNRLSMSWVLLTSLSTFAFGGGVRKALAPPVPSSNADAFIPFDLGVGRDQHYSLSDRRYFTNVVAVAVGDLDGDTNQDIVMLANAIPQNGAYSSAGPTQNHQYSHYCYGSTVFTPVGIYWHGEFVEPGDMLYNAAGILGGVFNPPDSSPGWFTADAIASLVGTSRTQTVHYAPPSPNVVAGMISSPSYIGSDLAWLQGDGRGNFTLRFITPRERGVLGPARIRMGTQIRLAKLSRSMNPGLDIVLISATDNRTNAYKPQASTSLEPFTGAGRVTWLENNGWAGPRLDFTDRGIAEYTYDRPPWIFYAAHQNTSSGWAGPYTSLQAIGVEILPINSGPEPDVLVANQPEETHASMDVRYDGTNPPLGTLNTYYSASIPRPRVGDLWVQNDRFWLTAGITGSNKTIFWYENTLVGGASHISTGTFHSAFENVVGSSFTATFRQLVPMRVRGGQAFVTMQEAGSGSQVYLRQPVADELVLSSGPTRIPPVFNFRNGRATAADIDGDGFDELLVDNFDCVGGCYHKVIVYSVTPNVGRTDVGVNELYHFVMLEKYGDFNGWAVSDMNGDGRNDIFIPSAGENGNLEEGVAATILVNTTPAGGPVSFFSVTQNNPVLPPRQRNTSRYAQVASGAIGAVNNSMQVATGDFNRDGSNDVVRVGPQLPVTVFLSNFDGLQRSRVTATVQDKTGETKTWTSVWGGTTVGPNIQPFTGDPATASGGIGIQAVQTE